MRKPWGQQVKDAAGKVIAPIVKALTPRPTPRRDPFYNDTERQREINRQARRRPHANQDAIDAIDEARRGGRWIGRRGGWLK